MDQYVQGGTFCPDGTLVLSSGKQFSTMAGTKNKRGGLRVIDDAGRLVERSWITHGISSADYAEYFRNCGVPWRRAFRYQYSNGDQEPEGVTYWDVGSVVGRHASSTQGQLHAILLNKDAGKDNIWLKHYSARVRAKPRAARSN